MTCARHEESEGVGFWRREWKLGEPTGEPLEAARGLLLWGKECVALE
jgi:hypothetical protein